MQRIFSEAVQRLAAFRASWDDNDEIDEASGLSATDLDLILAQLQPVLSDPIMCELRDNLKERFR